nr:10337_t:CDS:1 [Entrophospora candida]
MVKKNRTCERCGYTCATPQKLREHLKRKNPCRPQNFMPVQAPMAKPEIIPTNTEPLVKNLNDRKPGETVKQWGSRLRKRYKEVTYDNYDQPKNLAECKRLYNDLMQADPEAFIPQKPLDEPAHSPEEDNFFSDPEIDHETGPGPQTQSKSAKNMSQRVNAPDIDEEFQRLSNITGDHEENLVFREQQLGPALKRRAVAVHKANAPRYHPDNGSDIRKMLESQRKPFREILEKEFDKRGQFKFALCSLTKFLVDKKPGANKEADKNKKSRTDWLRNKQIIVYNRAEIDDYISNAFEQILYQVEERGGKSSA